MLNKLKDMWQMLDGNKTLIGLATMQIEQKIGLPDVWYVQLFVIFIYLWTGVGVFHKLIKAIG